MTRVAGAAAAVLIVPVLVLTGCGGPSAADVEVCAAASGLDPVARNPVGGSLAGAKEPAAMILRQLSGYAPDSDRLVRAIDRARDDAQAIIDGFSPLSFPKIEGGVAALEGSLSAVKAVCGDLGA